MGESATRGVRSRLTDAFMPEPMIKPDPDAANSPMLAEEPNVPTLLDNIRTALKRPRSSEEQPPPEPSLESLLASIEGPAPAPSSLAVEEGEPAAKRQKTEGDAVLSGTEAQDDGEAAWGDIGAILQDALGGLEDIPMEGGNSLGASQAVDATTSDNIAPLATASAPIPAPPKRIQKRLPFDQNPMFMVQSMGLPILGSVAVQVLHALAGAPREETLKKLHEEGSEAGKAYRRLKMGLDWVRGNFSESSAILQQEELGIKELGDQETVQMANMATIAASVFEADDVPLAQVHEAFLTTFLPETGGLSRDLGAVFVSLKTQRMVQEFSETQTDEERLKVLDALFPDDAEEQLKGLHPETPLSIQELEFLSELKARKALLTIQSETPEQRKALKEQYPMDGFRNELIKYLQENHNTILEWGESQGIELPIDEEAAIEDQLNDGALSSLAEAIARAEPTAVSGLSTAAGEMAQAQTHGMDGASSEALNLSKLIQDSLQREDANQTAVPGAFDASALAALIQSQGLAGNAYGSAMSSHGRKSLIPSWLISIELT